MDGEPLLCIILPTMKQGIDWEGESSFFMKPKDWVNECVDVICKRLKGRIRIMFKEKI